VNRALVVLTGGAFLTLVVEATVADQPLLAITLAAVFAVLAVVAYGWIDQQEPRRRRRLAVAYVTVQLPLGYLLFGAAGAGVGATLLLMPFVSGPTTPETDPDKKMPPPTENLPTDVKELQRQLAEANLRLRGYAAQAEELATTQERNRLARDIHDGLGHHLTVVQMQVQAARAVLSSDPAKADAVLAKAQQQSTEALAEVRRSVAALREPRTAPPLAEALAALAEDASAAGVPTELRVTGTVRPLGPEAEESLFRAAQEGLTNVRKHAGAGRARLVLDYRDDGTVRLDVCDDGRGVTLGGDGFGLVGLRERAERLGGRVDVESAPGRGTTLRVAVPG